MIYLEDVFKAAIEKAQAIMQEKSPDLPCMEDVAKDVAWARWCFLRCIHNRIKDVVFSWDRALNFDAKQPLCAVYPCALLLGAGQGRGCAQVSPDYGALADPFAQALIACLKIPATVREAALCAMNRPL